MLFPGIYFGKIFEPFFQIKGDAKGGTGLGLSLVKHLVEQHEGNISVFSDASSSRFVVDLPWQKKAVPPPRHGRDGYSATRGGNGPRSGDAGAAAD